LLISKTPMGFTGKNPFEGIIKGFAQVFKVPLAMKRKGNGGKFVNFRLRIDFIELILSKIFSSNF